MPVRFPQFLDWPNSFHSLQIQLSLPSPRFSVDRKMWEISVASGLGEREDGRDA